MKVIGFDSWTQGAHHYLRLVDTFKAKGIELILIHLGSWGTEKGRPEKEMIGNLEVRDIAYYNRKSFSEIIESENPSAVIFLSTHTFSHRAFNRYIRYRNIPSIHLYHGLVRVQAVVGSDSPYKPNLIHRLKFATSQLPRALKYVWPAYARALWETGATAGEWSRFGYDIVSGAMGMHSKTVADDARTNGCCIYAAADIENAVQRYGYAREKVFVVGNPDLIHFGLTTDMIGSKLALPLVDRSDVMYVDTGLVYVGGFAFQSKEEFVQHMVDTKNQLEQQGRHLIFKPHPQHLMNDDILSDLIAAGVDICSNQDFLSRLQRCCACIVEPTSLSVVPALMGMPLLLANYG
ncbi:MAG: hypothetical protein M1550_02570, partial [Deltaproteobacteria bacterium]|nr:hypothetical protein [Deltaproteobacteria bacterium]